MATASIALTLLSGPGTSYASTGVTVPSGSTVTYYWTEGSYYYIKYGSTCGYAKSTFVTLSSEATETFSPSYSTRWNVTTSTVYTYYGWGTTYTRAGSISGGEEVSYLGKKDSTSGYAFIQYSTSSGYKRAWIDANKLTATNPNTTYYTVTFYHYSTSGTLLSTSSESIASGTAITISNYAKSISGYTYSYATNSSGTVITGTPYITSAKTFYLYYTSNTTYYTVTFYHYSTSGTLLSTSSASIASGTAITVSNYAKSITGYTYSYATNSSGTVITGTPYITSTRSYYLYYAPISYTVTFYHYSTGGTLLTTSTASISYGTTITVSNYAKSISGYTYSYATDSSGNVITGTPYITSAKTFYLYYTSNAVTYTLVVYYDANGGSGAPSASTFTNTSTSTSCTVSGTLSSTTPTRSGYTFLGWSTSSSATSASYLAGSTYSETISSTSATTTLYAIWRKTITLSYNANGGIGAPSSQSQYVYNSTTSYTFTISSTQPTYSGYSFLGWSTSSSATAASYYPSGTITLSSSATLYAIWKDASGVVYINGVAYKPYIYTTIYGSGWTKATPYVYSNIYGSGWTKTKKG